MNRKGVGENGESRPKRLIQRILKGGLIAVDVVSAVAAIGAAAGALTRSHPGDRKASGPPLPRTRRLEPGHVAQAAGREVIQGAGVPLLSRRELLTGVSLGAAGLGGVLLAIPVISSLLAPQTRRITQVWRSVGAVDSFTIGDTVEVSFENADPLPWAGLTSSSAAWLRRETQQTFTAFSIDCTHLGCPLRWVAAAQLFMCPCHGGVFYGNGDPAAGPPLLPMVRYPVRVQSGQVQILTSPVPIYQ